MGEERDRKLDWGPALSLALDRSASEPVSTCAKEGEAICRLSSQTCEDGIR